MSTLSERLRVDAAENAACGIQSTAKIELAAAAELDRLQSLLDTILDGAYSSMWKDGDVTVNVNLWKLPRCDGRNGTLLETAEKARTK